MVVEQIMPLRPPRNIYIFAMIFLSSLSLNHALQSSSIRGVVSHHHRKIYTSSSLKPTSFILSRINTRSSYQSSFSSFSTSSSSSSTFEPPEPPAFNGQPVFPNVDLTHHESNSQGSKRNEDPNSIFVVTGASRGRFCNVYAIL